MGASPALMRLSFVGSVLKVTLTIMPGCRSERRARCPFRLISVNCVIANVFITWFSVIVIESGLTLAITVGCCSGAFGFFFELAKAGAGRISATMAERTMTWRCSLFIRTGANGKRLLLVHRNRRQL